MKKILTIGILLINSWPVWGYLLKPEEDSHGGEGYASSPNNLAVLQKNQPSYTEGASLDPHGELQKMLTQTPPPRIIMLKNGILVCPSSPQLSNNSLTPIETVPSTTTSEADKPLNKFIREKLGQYSSGKAPNASPPPPPPPPLPLTPLAPSKSKSVEVSSKKELPSPAPENELLTKIQAGVKLKPVQERKEPSSTGEVSSSPESNIIAKALEQRRNSIHDNDEDEDEENFDWE